MSQEFKTVTTNDGQEIKSVDQLLKKIGELEEKAYVQGVKDTLGKILVPLRGVANLLNKTIANIEATLAVDDFVNKASEPVPTEVDAPPLEG